MMKKSMSNEGAYTPLPATPGIGTPVSPPVKSPLFPGRPSLSRETFGAWQVKRLSGDGKAIYLLSYEQELSANRPITLAVELAVAATGNMSGVFVLPFGLSLTKGLTFQIDDGRPSRALSFTTCLPTGCLAQLEFDAATVKTLLPASHLSIEATVHHTSKNIVFSVPLDGFSSAYQHVLEMIGQTSA
jgi:invasion protein IalB